MPIAKFCGLAPKLYSQYGSGRAAAMSTAFHAMCAGDNSILLRLTAEERDDVMEWKLPADVVLEDGMLLRYSETEKELEVCLSEMGWSCERADAMLVGHLDFAWLVTLPKPHLDTKIAYVADIKKTRWTTTDGPESLQLHGYGMAYAQLRGAAGYCTGIFIPTEGEHGEWQWSKEIVWLGSVEHANKWAELAAAAVHESDVGSTGPHCSNCYARLHCPEWTLPAVLGSTVLGALAEGNIPEPERAGELVRNVLALEKIVEKAKENLKEWVRRLELRVVDGGKQWGPVMVQGRESWDSAALEAALGGDTPKYKRRGEPYPQYRWTNVPKKQLEPKK